MDRNAKNIVIGDIGEARCVQHHADRRQPYRVFSVCKGPRRDPLIRRKLYELCLAYHTVAFHHLAGKLGLHFLTNIHIQVDMVSLGYIIKTFNIQNSVKLRVGSQVLIQNIIPVKHCPRAGMHCGR